MTQADYYQVLGIDRAATPHEIRAAFVRLTKLHHPDLAHGDTELPGRLQSVQQAYHCLSDPDTRAAHDRALADIERDHFARQRAVQRRLRRYDQRHPHPPPRVSRRPVWLILLAVAAVVLVGVEGWLSLPG